MNDGAEASNQHYPDRDFERKPARTWICREFLPGPEET